MKNFVYVLQYSFGIFVILWGENPSPRDCGKRRMQIQKKSLKVANRNAHLIELLCADLYDFFHYRGLNYYLLALLLLKQQMVNTILMSEVVSFCSAYPHTRIIPQLLFICRSSPVNSRGSQSPSK